MIKKIISGGQTGADRAALDVAMRLSIPHGGWIPKGRIAEDGTLPEEYQLKEMPTASYPKRIEQNVKDSDGTLIISRGKPTGESDYTQKMALKNKKHLLHIDLNLTTSFDAASLIVSWLKLHRIKILNVAGPRSSKDPNIYVDVFRILEWAFKIYRMEEISPAEKVELDKIKQSKSLPKTVKEAVNRLISELSLKDNTTIANMAEAELSSFHRTLGEYISNEFGLWTDNKDLMASCRFIAKRDKIREDEASSIIIRELWKKLRETHKLRVIK
jgi:hypothetical protein